MLFISLPDTNCPCLQPKLSTHLTQYTRSQMKTNELRVWAHSAGRRNYSNKSLLQMKRKQNRRYRWERHREFL